MAWSKIGGPAHSLAIFGDTLAALSPNAKEVWIYKQHLDTWKKIKTWNKKVSNLIGGAWDLYVVTRSHILGLANIMRYNGTKWKSLDGTWSEIVGICNTVYALDADRTKLFRFNRYLEKWKDIGNIGSTTFGFPREMHLVGGGSRLYVTNNSKNEIWEYSRITGKLKKIGNFAASVWVGAGDSVYALRSNNKEVLKHVGLGLWVKIGGPAIDLIGGGSLPYAIEPGTSDLSRYRGKGQEWDKIGTPGTGFVAVGNMIYGMTTDKKEVHQFDDSNAESKRLWDLLKDIYAKESRYGNRVMRGFLVKEMNGKILVEHHSNVCFQPHSTLKLLPYLHAIIDAEANKKKTLHEIEVSWIEPNSGLSGDTPCLDPSDSNNRMNNEVLFHVLPTMMWESHGMMLEALFAKYGTINITKKAQSLGLSQTEMYPGCPQPDGLVLWYDNITTLLDLAKIFEGVQSLKFLQSGARTFFQNNMINYTPPPGSSYESPITGNTTPSSTPDTGIGYTNQDLDGIVDQEAAAAGMPPLAVQIFKSNLSYRGKGGGINPATKGDLEYEIGCSFFVELTVPFKVSGHIKLKKFLVGWFINQRKVSTAAQETKELEKLDDFSKREIFSLPIRLAINTW